MYSCSVFFIGVDVQFGVCIFSVLLFVLMTNVDCALFYMFFDVCRYSIWIVWLFFNCFFCVGDKFGLCIYLMLFEVC